VVLALQPASRSAAAAAKLAQIRDTLASVAG
jgi:hypothetical protein